MWDDIWVILQGDLWSGTSVVSTLEAVHPSFHMAVASWDNS